MIKEESWAKLNLSLNLLPQKLPNGFYPVKFINCETDLHDELFFEARAKDIEIICEDLRIPQENNLAYKAAIFLKKLVQNPKLGVKITLKKKIPLKAGLGGGSSNAAATIKGLSQLWQTHLTEQTKHLLAGKLGKDVYYSLKGGLCEVSGDGSKVVTLEDNLQVFHLLIIVPKEEKPSTAWMYQHLNKEQIGKNIDKYKKLYNAIKEKNKKGILNNLFNDFESLAVASFPIIQKIKKDLEKADASKTLLAGSGLSVVGFYETERQAVKAKEKLLKIYPQIIYAKTK